MSRRSRRAETYEPLHERTTLRGAGRAAEEVRVELNTLPSQARLSHRTRRYIHTRDRILCRFGYSNSSPTDLPALIACVIAYSPTKKDCRTSSWLVTGLRQAYPQANPRRQQSNSQSLLVKSSGLSTRHVDHPHICVVFLVNGYVSHDEITMKMRSLSPRTGMIAYNVGHVRYLTAHSQVYNTP